MRQPAQHARHCRDGNGQLVPQLQGPAGRSLGHCLYNLSFSPDGKKLLSSSEDTTASVWDLTGKFRDSSLGNPLAAAELDALWSALADDDAAKAFVAMQRLAGSPKDALPYVNQRIKPLPRVPEKELARLIADLESNDFKTREHAARDLDKLGEAALVAIDAALTSNPSAEARQRLESLKEKHNPWRTATTERLRMIRVLETLEMCGAEARKLLTILADGAPGAYVTEQAKSALQRQSRSAE